jgi:alpha-N-arabinofuranosidase
MFSKTLATLSAIAAAVQAVTFTVESSGGNATSPFQYGIMYEDINNSGDGGVYAELVQNRAFQGNTIFPANLWWWYPIGGVDLALSNLSDPLSSALPSSMQVTGGSASEVGFWNEGSLLQDNPARIPLINYQASGASQLSLHGSTRARFTSTASLTGISQ